MPKKKQKNYGTIKKDKPKKEDVGKNPRIEIFWPDLDSVIFRRCD